MKISVVIVNYNGMSVLPECLDSLLPRSSSIEMEILVVDNASKDGSLEWLRELTYIRLLENRENLGFAAANNQAMSLASGDAFLLLNSDAFLQSGALETLVEALREHPDAGVVAPELRNPDGSLQDCCGAFPGPRAVMGTKLWRRRPSWGRLLPRSHRPAESGGEVDWVSGACMLVRREVYESAGGLDEGLFMYFEDVDWCSRIRQRGWKIRVIPGALVVHIGGASGEGMTPRLSVEYRQSQRMLFRKHLSFPGYLLATGLLFAFDRLSAR